MMKRILIATVLAATAATSAHAIGRYNINSMSCDRVQDIVASDGAAILRYTSPTSGMTLYDRYVANGSWCETPKVMKSTSVPTADEPYCPVYFCKEPTWKKN